MAEDYLVWVEMNKVHVHSFVDITGKLRVTDNPNACFKCQHIRPNPTFEPLNGVTL